MHGLIDTTLREGAQAVGVHFSLAEKIAIFRQLVMIGIEEIEIGLAANGIDLADLTQSCHSIKQNSRIALWSRCRNDDIQAAARLRPDVLSLSIPASDRHLNKRLNRDRQWALAAMKNSIKQAQNIGIPTISVGLEDGFRADFSFLKQLAQAAGAAGAHRLRLADTVGTATPTLIQQTIARLKTVTPLAIGIHAHNDFGMATANTITALEAGASWADVSVLGLGERAGMARLEEVAGFLTLIGNQPRRYRAGQLKGLARTVSQAARREINPHRPVIGNEIFACETGLHLQGLLRDPGTYEPFDPERVGSKRQLLFGTKVGEAATRELLNGQGLHCLPQQDASTSLANTIRILARTRQRPLTFTEASTLASAEKTAIHTSQGHFTVDHEGNNPQSS